MTCTPTGDGGSDSDSGSSGGGSNAGAIAGGVIGGIAVIAIGVFLFWWFVIRKKRKEEEAFEKNFATADNRQPMQARRSVASIASTVFTRASNVIQIAYIPGVTNRSPPDTPGTLVPPVPPLPGASADQHFFMPGDLRDSAWSGMSEAERRSLAPSLARSSVATTVYRSNAIVSPIPAQQIVRTKAAMVSVKSGGSTPSQTPPRSPQTGVDAPEVPAITTAQLAKAGVVDTSNSSIVARTVTAKPVNVRKISPLKESTSQSSAKGQPEPSASQPSKDTSSFDDESSDEEDSAKPARKSARQSVADSSPDSPFADSHATSGSGPAINTAVSTSRNSLDGKGTHRQRSSVGSTRLLEEALTNAAKDSKPERGSSHSRSSSLRNTSPFSDSNEVKSS
ncbi:overproduction-induced pheromone-resistant [Paecilomyces lecythidis]|uniref:Overproduction-induced pheromone-resistant n=1 Tax=Paecilomyces lecythidis TaxID=3004212 RepID=A0ABR3WX00_9EURO